MLSFGDHPLSPIPSSRELATPLLVSTPGGTHLPISVSAAYLDGGGPHALTCEFARDNASNRVCCHTWIHMCVDPRTQGSRLWVSHAHTNSRIRHASNRADVSYVNSRVCMWPQRLWSTHQPIPWWVVALVGSVSSRAGSHLHHAHAVSEGWVWVMRVYYTRVTACVPPQSAGDDCVRQCVCIMHVCCRAQSYTRDGHPHRPEGGTTEGRTGN